MAEACEDGGVNCEGTQSRNHEVTKFRNFVISCFLVFALPAHAQPTPDQQTFLTKCNPQQKAELARPCDCLMQSVEKSLTLAEFNQLDARAAQGNLPDAEVSQKARLVAQAKPALKECLSKTP